MSNKGGKCVSGIFCDCISISDVKEFQVVKHKDCEKGRKTWGGEKVNSCNFLSVMDHTGRCIYAQVCLGKNEREVFASSPLICQKEITFL